MRLDASGGNLAAERHQKHAVPDHAATAKVRRARPLAQPQPQPQLQPPPLPPTPPPSPSPPPSRRPWRPPSLSPSPPPSPPPLHRPLPYLPPPLSPHVHPLPLHRRSGGLLHRSGRPREVSAHHRLWPHGTRACSERLGSAAAQRPGRLARSDLPCAVWLYAPKRRARAALTSLRGCAAPRSGAQGVRARNSLSLRLRPTSPITSWWSWGPTTA